MDGSTPGLPVRRQLPESAQTHVHSVGYMHVCIQNLLYKLQIENNLSIDRSNKITLADILVPFQIFMEKL